MNQAKANLFVVSAPSGAGKTSLLKKLISELNGVQTSISHTTRAKRAAEVDGVDYHFVEPEAFKLLVEQEAFYEHAEVFGNHYGTSKSSIANQREQGIDVILEIDWQGARQIKQQLPESLSIFILPPSKQELESRLQGRGQDDEAIIKGRMDAAISEMSHYNEYDYVVINDDFEQAVFEIKAIIVAERQKLAIQSKKHAQLLCNLLE
ncbi:MAG: guanylate kinase [Kangiellaceae bacterium]|jgi:guanylate kinase